MARVGNDDRRRNNMGPLPQPSATRLLRHLSSYGKKLAPHCPRHAMPRAAMAFALMLAAAFFFATLKIVRTREYKRVTRRLAIVGSLRSNRRL